MCADTDFIEEKENIVIFIAFTKKPQEIGRAHV